MLEGNTKGAILVVTYERWHTTTYIGVGVHICRTKMTDQEAIDIIKKRRELFASFLSELPGANRRNDVKNLPNTCPSCGFPTLSERCAWEICSICFWEDDGQDDAEEDKVWGGPNSHYSLTSHRIETHNMLTELMNTTSDELSSELKTLVELANTFEQPDNQRLVQQTKKVAELFDQKRGIPQ